MSDRSSTPTVSSRLIRLVLVFLAPVLLLSVAAVYAIYRYENERYQEGVLEATRAISLVVERELAQREAVLHTLARSPTLTNGDLEAFYQYAREVMPANDAVIVLADLSGQQLLNTRRPFGDKQLPQTAFVQARARGERGTLVSDLYYAPFGRQWSFAMEVPVERNGKVIHYLAMGSFAAQLQKVVADQRLPAGWIGSVIDRNGTVVARSISPEKYIGRRVSDSMLQRFTQGTEGVARAIALDGTPVIAAFSRPPSYGWGFIIGVPARQITHPLYAAGLFGAVALLLLAAVLVAAARVARQIAGPVQKVYAASQRLGQPGDLPPEATGLFETDRVLHALRESHQSVRDSQAEMQSRISAALAEAHAAQRAVVQNQRLEAIGHLTGGVAHDFNNLLMVVANNAHLLGLRHPELKGGSALAGIQRAVATGSKLTRQLLSFAHRQAVQPEIIRLQQHLPGLVDLIRPALRSNIQLECHVDEHTPPVLLDPAELELSLINLAVNARDAMPGGGTLTLSARCAAGDRSRVVIEVRDTGKGIPKDILDRVFEPFFTTKPVGHGTGLGLSQVYGFATQAGGSVRIESAPGAGTTVRLVLPSCDQEPAVDTATVTRRAHIENVHVLLVEDNADLAQVTRALLVGSGATVTAMGTGDDAKAALAGGLACDCVLSDIRMPGATSGVDLAAWIREHRKGLPVVLMTGYSQELDVATGQDLVVLRKPCLPDTLIGTLAQAVALQGRASRLPAVGAGAVRD